MIVTISGLHGTGKSTVGKNVAESLGINYYSTGDAFRELAGEMNMTLEHFSDYVENHPEIDNNLDDKVVEMGKKRNILVDAQLSGYLLEKIADFKVLLICPLEIRINRMAERDGSSFEQKLNETTVREDSELERFKRMYNIDLNDSIREAEVYDLIIDTENTTVEEVVKIILSAIRNPK